MPRSLLAFALFLAAIPVQAQYADLAFANVLTNGAANQVCRNDGTATFTCGPIVPSDGLRQSRGTAAGDFDGDGDDDLAFANVTNSTGTLSAANRVCRNDGGGAFTCSDLPGDIHNSQSVEAADLDGDGDVDLVIGNLAAADQICRNNGSGAFTCSDLSADVVDTWGIAPVDLDGDGDVDLALALMGAPNRACLNNGSGAFTCANVSADSGASTGVTAADMDGDDDPDLVFSRFPGRDRVCLNQGSSFTCSDVSTSAPDTYAVAAGDFDGDGDNDLGFAASILNNRSQNNLVCLNDGSGTVYTCSALSTDTDQSHDIAALDLDGDGDVDLAVANEDLFTIGPGRGVNQACLNNGSGVFTCQDIAPQEQDTFGLAVGNFGGAIVAAEGTPEAGGLALRLDGPNPTSDRASLVLTTSRPGAVTVEVLDALGRRVAWLYSGTPLPDRPVALTWDTRAVPPGVYLARATGKSEITVQAIVVTR